MKTKTEIKDMMWELGHNANPAIPTGVDRYGDWMDKKFSSTTIRTGIRSYTTFMAYDFNRLVQKHHNRLGIADGDVGPATLELFEVPRCGFPDFDNGDSEYGWATGSGSWPVGCYEEYPNDHVMKIHVDKSNMPSFLAPVFDEALKLCVDSYAEVGLRIVEVAESDADTVMSFTPGRGWIGLAIVPSSFSCGMRPIWAKFDTRYNPSDLVNQWARLLAHELGHNCGWGHWNGGIMNPGIIRGPYDRFEWRNDASWPRPKKAFGGEPIDVTPGPGPGPGPPPVSGNLSFKGELEAYDEAGGFHGTFHLTPAKTPPFGG